MLKFLIFLYLFFVTASAWNHGFCNTYCPHIVCCFMNKNCPFDKDDYIGSKLFLFPSTPYITDQVLFEINARRNKLACERCEYNDLTGKKIPKAANMLEMVWDAELAYLSQIYTSNCVLSQEDGEPEADDDEEDDDEDQNDCKMCSSLENFHKPGKLQRFNNNLNLKTFIGDTIQEWWSGHENVESEDLSQYERKNNTYGFAMLAKDNTTHVGCSISLCKGKDKYLFMHCHFAREPETGSPIYKIGARNCSEESLYWDCLCKPPGYLCENEETVFRPF